MGNTATEIQTERKHLMTTTDDRAERGLMAETFSFEIALANSSEWPPFTDSCPRCVDMETGVFVPYATTTEGNVLIAFYRHKRCGHQWSCHWGARWSSAWVL